MTLDTPSTPPPGWYMNQTGQMQWWDGKRWGPVAPAAQVGPVLVRPAKDAGIAYLLAILLGGFSAHRFYLNRPGSAVTQMLMWWGGLLLTTVGVGVILVVVVFIWWIIDLFLIPGMVRSELARR